VGKDVSICDGEEADVVCDDSAAVYISSPLENSTAASTWATSLAEQKYQDFTKEREEEDAFLYQAGLDALEDRLEKGLWKPRLGPRFDELSAEQQRRVQIARQKGGTVASCGCYSGRGIVPASNTKDLLDPLLNRCCQWFDPLVHTDSGQGDNHILNTTNMKEDLGKLPYWDRTIADVMAAGATMYYTGDDRTER